MSIFINSVSQDFYNLQLKQLPKARARNDINTQQAIKITLLLVFLGELTSTIIIVSTYAIIVFFLRIDAQHQTFVYAPMKSSLQTCNQIVRIALSVCYLLV